MTTYPAISLWQPYATLIATRAKRWETRHWTPPASVIGQRIAIHAALRRPTRQEIKIFTADSRIPLGWQNNFPFGAIVCTAVLSAARRVDHWNFEGFLPKVVLENGAVIEDDGFGDYTVGRWCWEMADVALVNPPVGSPCRGRQGWFTWDGPTT